MFTSTVGCFFLFGFWQEQKKKKKIKSFSSPIQEDEYKTKKKLTYMSIWWIDRTCYQYWKSNIHTLFNVQGYEMPCSKVCFGAIQHPNKKKHTHTKFILNVKHMHGLNAKLTVFYYTTNKKKQFFCLPSYHLLSFIAYIWHQFNIDMMILSALLHANQFNGDEKKQTTTETCFKWINCCNRFSSNFVRFFFHDNNLTQKRGIKKEST